ncbi:MAG: type II toxin-antitoxin system PemK/MazF family toxin [Anaerolineales bacterium]
MRYKIVLVPFPFDDLSSQKVRPAVCLTEPIGIFGHVVLAFITSSIPSDLLPTDIALLPQHPDFATTGLRVASTLRLHRLITLSFATLQRQLGELSPTHQSKVQIGLRNLFNL